MATKREEIESGCLSGCADDEPVFVVRAKDILAPTVVRVWAMFANIVGVHPDKTAEANGLAHRMDVWQREHGAKVPD